ncbi:MAG: polysaccharide biosynthesis protein [Planctomycetota bacterium]|jgi:FlaA1/EpsC-like NDP-sugar epimerase|nr:polysaccharide biosynthesis protein [Planctomycetota bacterium]
MPDFVMSSLKIWDNRFVRIVLLMLMDALVFSFSLSLSFWLRFDLWDSSRLYTFYLSRLDILPWLIAIRWLVGWVANTYRWSFWHASLHEGVNIIGSTLVGSGFFILLGHGLGLFASPPPRSIYAMEFAFTLLGSVGLRFIPRYIHLLHQMRHTSDSPVNAETTAIVYGAGGNAELLVRELSRTRGHGYNLVGFVDDDRGKWGSRIHGLKVLGDINALPGLIDRLRVREILVAIPEFSGPPLRRLLDICGPKRVKFKVIPSFPSRLDHPGARLVENIRVEALLERQLVDSDPGRAERLLGGQTVLVTGAAGSIGSELSRQIAAAGVARLVLFDLDENSLYFLAEELREKRPGIDLRVVVGSIRDQTRLERVLRENGVKIVFHAAAHKHVPLMEDNPCEALKNNVLGTANVLFAARAAGVTSLTAVSTDKAVEAASVMGASKALAEWLTEAMSRQSTMRSIVVRFGNVLGSNGSLLQIIRRQIAQGKPVTVTHPEMTRYFMAIPEAVTLILMAASLEESGTYLLDMGEPINIDHLVRQILMLNGLTPDVDIAIRYSPPRPGE